jgi:hypothetical protein
MSGFLFVAGMLFYCVHTGAVVATSILLSTLLLDLLLAINWLLALYQ